jgi:hypothetical protein
MLPYAVAFNRVNYVKLKAQNEVIPLAFALGLTLFDHKPLHIPFHFQAGGELGLLAQEEDKMSCWRRCARIALGQEDKLHC